MVNILKFKLQIIMKRRYIFILIALVFAMSCVDDNTVDNFNQLNEVTIEGLEKSYKFNLFEETNIEPTIITLDNDESNLEYRWYMYNNNHRYEADTLSREKNLNVVMGGTPGLSYTLVFKVIDKNTDVFYSKTMKAEVLGELTKGTMFLCEEDGVVDVNFMKPDSTIVRSIYSVANSGDRIEGEPVKLFFINANAYNPAIMKHVYITTESSEGGYIVDPITFQKTKSLRDNFYVTPEYKTLKATNYYKGNMADYLFINGKLFNRAANMADPIWKTELLITASDQPREYDLADFTLFSSGSPIIYDNKYGRFLQHAPENKGELFVFTGGSKTAFDYNNSGLKMLYSTQITLPVGSDGRYSFAIAEDPTIEKRYMLKYLIGKRGNDPQVSVYADLKKEIVESVYSGLSKSQIFASDYATMPGVLWYANGGKLYSMNTFDENPIEVLQKDFSSEGILIDQMEFFSFKEIDPTSDKELTVTELRLAVRDTKVTKRQAGMIYMRGNTIGGVNISEVSRKLGIADKIFDFEEKLN